VTTPHARKAEPGKKGCTADSWWGTKEGTLANVAYAMTSTIPCRMPVPLGYMLNLSCECASKHSGLVLEIERGGHHHRAERTIPSWKKESLAL
jgi:hypothetical protein